MIRPGKGTLREQQSVLARARAAQAQLAAIFDSFLASGTPLDPSRLVELDRFIHAQAFPAAREYEQLLTSVTQLDAHSADKS